MSAIPSLAQERWGPPLLYHLAWGFSAHMSPSRFAVLYRRVLGVSPAEDLIEARLARA